ncbi:MAG: NAD-dependent epimerase/dehydratase family protein [Acidobacteria bacterium]|nr:NAD-dependent epimerase/dehydratase family protein [Acidobacteriota bacterium]
MDLGSLRGARCLVTGGAGFIGSNLTRALVDAGARTIVVDNFSTGRREHLPGSPLVDLMEADVATMPELEDVVAQCAFVFHLAAQVGNVKSIAAPVPDATANIVGTVRLLDACRRHRPIKVVYSSSSAIFGEAREIPIGEEHATDPASFYALSKLTGERYARLAHSLWNVPTVCLRYFNVFGLPMEHNEYTGVISIFLTRLTAGEPLAVYGDGTQVRDFVHVDDIVQANLRAALLGAPGTVCNIGTGVPTTIAELARAVMQAAGRTAPIEHRPARAGEVRRSLADITRARSVLAFEPQVTLADGLREMWRRLGAGASR